MIMTPGQLARVRRMQEGGEVDDPVVENPVVDDAAQPFVDNIVKTESRLDPITMQFLFGLDGQGGFLPGAFRAAERTFFDEEGRPIVIPTEVAGFSPDQIRAFELARQNIGIQQPFIDEAMALGRRGIGSIRQGLADQALASGQGLEAIREGARFALDQRDLGLQDALSGIQEGRGRAVAAEERLRGDLRDLERRGVRDTQRFGMDLGRARDIGLAETARLRRGLGESRRLLEDTTGDFDIIGATQRLQDPFEDQVVQQMIQDATEGLAKQDLAQFARDVATGGESAFGSRARLSAAERAEALGRGLAKQVGGLRSEGFRRAQQTAISEDERDRQAKRAAATGLASLRGQDFAAGTGFGDLIRGTAREQLGAQTGLGEQLSRFAQSRFGAGTDLGSRLSNLGLAEAAARGTAGSTGMDVAGTLASQFGQIGREQAAGGATLGAAQSGYGSTLAGLGGQAQRAGAADVASLSGIGGMQQGLRQRELDAQRRDLEQARMAPLAQYQALMPFASMVPAGTTQFTTNFGMPPSALQAGLGVGLSTLGAMGNFTGQPQYNYYAPQQQQSQPQG